MMLIFSDGFEFVEGDEMFLEWISASRQEFMDVISFTCVKCHCRTTVAVPKGDPVTIGDVVCPMCKEVLLLTTFTAQSQ